MPRAGALAQACAPVDPHGERRAVSVEASTWAWRQRISHSRQLVLLALADHADNHGVCWPSQRKIREKTGLGRTTVADALRWLERHGYILREVQKRPDGGRGSDRCVLARDPVPDIGTPCQDPAHPPPKAGPAPGRKLAGKNHQKEPSRESSLSLPPSLANAEREAGPDGGSGEDQDLGHDVGELVAEVATSLRASERSGRGRS
jgi:biotin operon repressor